MTEKFFLLGTFFAGLAVATGAFGAHGLEKMVTSDQLNTWEKAVRYQFYHAVGLFIVAWALTQWQGQAKWLAYAGWAFVIGILFFSGSLYLLVLTGTLKLGPINLAYITPAGGFAFVIGWILLIKAVWQFR